MTFTTIDAMTTTLVLILWILSGPFIVFLAVLFWLTEDCEARARRWHKAGMSQSAIAHRLGVSRYRVRQWIAA